MGGALTGNGSIMSRLAAGQPSPGIDAWLMCTVAVDEATIRSRYDASEVAMNCSRKR